MPTAAKPDLELRSVPDLEPVLSAGRWLIFKHSTRCPISAHANSEFAEWLGASASRPKTALCLVVESRPVSNAIAERLAIRHESPQVILIDDGKVLWHASHGAITAKELASRCSAD